MNSMKLPGLERLMEVCQRFGLPMAVAPPAREPPAAGSWVGGHRLDPMLAAFYSRFGKALFNKDLYLLQVDDEANQLEEESRRKGESWRTRFALPLFDFGGKAALAYYYATVPGLADARGCQPVVKVDMYDLDGPHALPIASDVDRFFEAYSLYLEALVAHPEFQEPDDEPLTFPWEVPEILARDRRLVELLRAARFDSVMKKSSEVQGWVSRVIHFGS
jgi:hypothetical protein